MDLYQTHIRAIPTIWELYKTKTTKNTDNTSILERKYYYNTYIYKHR